ncbi:MAG: lipid-binding SYLF domain-containing protein [Syntrophobacteraceae bacterium]
MKASRLFGVILALCLAFNSIEASAGMQDDVDRAASIIQRFQSIPENAIPDAVMSDAKGLAIITMMKVGFILSGRGGSGVVIARTGRTWSGPCAIGTGGAGFGFQIGGQVSELVFVLNTEEAIKAFSRGGNLTLGADLSVAAGPVGRNAGVAIGPMAAVYTYSRSQGLFAGISLEGTVIVTRDEANAEYYGNRYLAADILAGRVNPPPGAQILIDALAKR